jgi:hypothetical protein
MDVFGDIEERELAAPAAPQSEGSDAVGVWSVQEELHDERIEFVLLSILQGSLCW